MLIFHWNSLLSDAFCLLQPFGPEAAGVESVLAVAAQELSGSGPSEPRSGCSSLSRSCFPSGAAFLLPAFLPSIEVRGLHRS